MRKFLGVDQSLRHPGFAAVDADGRILSTDACILASAARGVARLSTIERHLKYFMQTEVLRENEEFSGGAIEGFSVGSQNRPFDLGEVSGVLRLCAYQTRGLDLRVVPPTSLKLFVTGNGQADKEEMLYHVKLKWGFETEDDNIADAIGLAQFSRAAILNSYSHRYEREAVFALMNPKKKVRIRANSKDNI